VTALREYSSPLSHFEPTELLDTLSTGIVVLDGQLCPIYANVSAQDFMAVSLKQARGRPFADLFYDARHLVAVLRRSLTALRPAPARDSLKAWVRRQREPS
jgi:nitrogen-specific signal transduction histidine kinase